MRADAGAATIGGGGSLMLAFARSRRVCLAVALAGAFTLTGSAAVQLAGSAAAPGAVPDQGNPVRASACRYSAWVPDDATSWTAQSFTAGVSGALSEVVLPLRIGSSPVVVAIGPIQADGSPAVSAPLASTTLTVATVTDSLVWSETTFSFSPAPRIVAGQRYAIVLSAPTTDPAANRGVAWRLDLGSSIHDFSGQACGDGAYTPGRAWASSGALGPDADYFFQTHVIPARKIAVATSGTGTGTVRDGRSIDCGLSCAGDYLAGETVTLTASPDPGSTFAGWTGAGCPVSELTCSFVAGDDVSVAARFTRTLVRLSVHIAGAGTVTSVPAGINCGKRCNTPLVPGPLTLTAKPARGWHFARWRGNCRGSIPVCRLTALRTTNITAIFAR